jgi:hypothetical protein
VRIKHGLKLKYGKKSINLPLKDSREKVEIRPGDGKMEFEKGVYKTYQRLVTENREALHLPET